MGKTEIAYEYIKDKILTWEYPPLSDLSEEAIQKALNISRTPVREAFLRLEKEGFVYIYSRKGTIVSEVTRDLIEEIYQIRELNETFVAVQAMRTIDRNWLEEMKTMILHPPASLTEEELKKYYIDIDRDLHIKILESCSNRYLKTIMRNVYDHNQRIRMKTSDPARDHDSTIEQHLRIIEAFLQQDKEQLEYWTAIHIQTSRQVTASQFG